MEHLFYSARQAQLDQRTSQLGVASILLPQTMSVEILISAVQQHPALWDPRTENYKDKGKKNSAWSQVCKILFDDFDSFSEDQQKLKIQDVSAKWKTVRDNYVRSLKKQAEAERSGSGGKTIKPYIHAEQLSFIKNAVKLNTVTPSLDALSDSSFDSQNFGENTTEDGDEGPNMESPPFQTSSASRTKLSANKRSRVGLMHSHKRPVIEEDDDLAFFYSILPTVRALTPDEKLSFRIHTMHYLQQVKHSHSSPHSFH